MWCCVCGCVALCCGGLLWRVVLWCLGCVRFGFGVVLCLLCGVALGRLGSCLSRFSLYCGFGAAGRLCFFVVSVRPATNVTWCFFVLLLAIAHLAVLWNYGRAVLFCCGEDEQSKPFVMKVNTAETG